MENLFPETRAESAGLLTLGVALAACGTSPDRRNRLSHQLCKLLILLGGTGGFACRSEFVGLLPRAARRLQMGEVGHPLSGRPSGCRPSPAGNLGTINAMLVCMGAASELAVAEFLLGVPANPLQFGNAVNRIDRQAEAIGLIIDR